MTTWDKIYKDFQQGGEAWATLSEDIDPRFIKLIKKTDFKVKAVFDIGCGTGKYLKFLQEIGFKTSGIDSSQASVQMTKDLLADGSDIKCLDMLKTDILPDQYDLIISVSTIHHGLKKDVQELINKIHASLLNDGYIFITLPDFTSSKKWNTFQNNKKMGEGTYVPLKGPEKGLPHSFYTKEEIEKLFSKFQDIKLELDEIGRWFVIAKK